MYLPSLSVYMCARVLLSNFIFEPHKGGGKSSWTRNFASKPLKKGHPHYNGQNANVSFITFGDAMYLHDTNLAIKCNKSHLLYVYSLFGARG